MLCHVMNLSLVNLCLNQQVNSDYKSLKSSSIIKMYHRPFDDLLTASIFSLIVDIIFKLPMKFLFLWKLFIVLMN